jgi:hypothetical protein
MALSFVYLAFVALMKLLIRCGRTVDVKDIELRVLCAISIEVLRRHVERPKLRASDRRAARRRQPGCCREGRQ